MAITFKQGGNVGVSNTKEGRSAVLYGPPFQGKTSTLQYDKSIKVALIDFDKNSGVVANEDNITIFGADTYEDLVMIREAAAAGVLKIGGQVIKMDFDLYAIDSFTSFEEAVKVYVAGTYAKDRKREISTKFGAMSDWQDLQDHEIAEVRAWQKLTRRPNNPINVLWIGHDMEALGSNDFAKRIQIRLQGKYAAPGIMSAVDAVFYMIKAPDPKDPNKLYFGVYTLDQTQGGTTYQAAARIPVKERLAMPPIIWWPKWGDIFRQIGATNIAGGAKDEPAASDSGTDQKTSG